jgi:hypothetical protein
MRSSEGLAAHVDNAIAFRPTVVRIEDARIIGKRLYLVLLLADADGEATIDRLGTDRTPESEPDAPERLAGAGSLRRAHPGARRPYAPLRSASVS